MADPGCLAEQLGAHPGGLDDRPNWKSTPPRTPLLGWQAPTIPLVAGAMAMQIKAGRLELVPPAAPGFSPVCTREVTRLCARS